MREEKRDFFIAALNADKGIYLDAASGLFYPMSTRDIMHAKQFATYREAEKACKKYGGEVLHYVIQPYGNVEEEVSVLQAAVRQFRQEKEELLRKIKQLEED